jgi:hypothetical protein
MSDQHVHKGLLKLLFFQSTLVWRHNDLGREIRVDRRKKENHTHTMTRRGKEGKEEMSEGERQWNTMGGRKRQRYT